MLCHRRRISSRANCHRSKIARFNAALTCPSAIELELLMTTRPSRALRQKATFGASVGISLALCVQAGYVELFQDSAFELKLASVNDVQTDVCYDLVCADSSSAAMSARVGGSARDRNRVRGRSSYDCVLQRPKLLFRVQWWPIDSQSDGDLGFPPCSPSTFLLSGDQCVECCKCGVDMPRTCHGRHSSRIN